MLNPNYVTITIVFLSSIVIGACQQTPPPFTCEDQIGCVTVKPDEPIKLSVIQALTGKAAFAGLPQTHGIELALAEHDNKLLGHPVELHYEDDQCSTESGANAALKVVADPEIVAIIGTTCSSSAAGASKVMSENGLVMVSGVNTGYSLTAIGNEKGTDWQPGYFRTIYNGVEVGQATAAFVFQELGLTQAVIISNSDLDSYTSGLTNMFEQTFVELGGEIVLEALIDRDDTDMEPILTAIADTNVKVIFMPLDIAEVTSVIQQAKEMGMLEDMTLIGGDSWLYDTIIEVIEVNEANIYIVGPSTLGGAEIDKLAAQYETEYNEPPPSSFYNYAYDATNLLLTAIETVAVQEADGTLHIGRQALRDTLYSMADVEGITGKLNCNQFGDCANAKFDVMQLKDPSTGVAGVKSNVIYTYEPE